MADVGTNIILGVIGKLVEPHQNHNSNVTQVKRDKITGRNRISGAAGEVTDSMCCKMERKISSTMTNTGPPVEIILRSVNQLVAERYPMLLRLTRKAQQLSSRGEEGLCQIQNSRKGPIVS